MHLTVQNSVMAMLNSITGWASFLKEPLVWFYLAMVPLLLLGFRAFAGQHSRPSIRRAVTLTVFWSMLAIGFNAFIFFWRGGDAASQFFTGWALEQSLSVDNLFVFLLIFTAFNAPKEIRSTALFFGVLGSIVARAVLLGAGTVVISRFSWLVYLVGAVLVWTVVRMFLSGDGEEETNVTDNPLLRLIRRLHLSQNQSYNSASINHKPRDIELLM